jgi:hypothetical protein
VPADRGQVEARRAGQLGRPRGRAAAQRRQDREGRRLGVAVQRVPQQEVGRPEQGVGELAEIAVVCL